jgi:hypothetical protein
MARSNQRVYQAIERVNQGTPNSNPYEVRSDGHSIELIHYGTKILELDAMTFFVLDFNPYSRTSNAAINTALEHYGVPRKLKAGKIVKV